VFFSPSSALIQAKKTKKYKRASEGSRINFFSPAPPAMSAMISAQWKNQLSLQGDSFDLLVLMKIF